MTLFVDFRTETASIPGIGEISSGSTLRLLDVGMVQRDGEISDVTFVEPLDTGTMNVLVYIPYISVETTERFLFGRHESVTDVKVFVGDSPSKNESYDVREFMDNFFHIMKSYSTRHLSQDAINILNDPEVKVEVLQHLRNNSSRSELTDAWSPLSCGFDLLYNSRGGERVTENPVGGTGVFGDVFEAQSVEGGEDLDRGLVREVLEYFDELGDLIQGSKRYLYFDLLLDYLFASLFKSRLASRDVRSVNFPILCVVGTAQSGKTWVAERVLLPFFNQGDKDEYLWSQSVFDGSSALTRIERDKNSVLPVLIDEVSDLSSFGDVVNKYLSQGYFVDKIGSSDGGKVVRKCFRSPVITTNSIRVQQQGSDARVQRFVFLNLSVSPVSDRDLMRRTSRFESYWSGHRLGRVGEGLFGVCRAFSGVWRRVVREVLSESEQGGLLEDFTSRDTNKANFFLFGRVLRRVLGEKMMDLVGWEGDNPFGTYTTRRDMIDVVLDVSTADSIRTNRSLMVDRLVGLLSGDVYDDGSRFYLNDVLSDTKNNRRGHDMFVDLEFGSRMGQRVAKNYYFLEKEVGLSALGEFGVFKVNRYLLQCLSTSSFNMTMDKFCDMFSGYTSRVSSSRVWEVRRDDEGEFGFVWGRGRGSDTVKFDVVRFLRDFS